MMKKNATGSRATQVVSAVLGVACVLDVVAAVRAATPASAAVASSGWEATEQAIRELEQAQDRAAVAGDRATLERIFAPDYRMVSPNGEVIDRAQLFALLMGGASPYKSAVYETQLVRNMGDVVVTVGMEDVVPNHGAQAGQMVHRRVTQVWQHRDGRWLLTLRHAMIVPEHLAVPAG